MHSTAETATEDSHMPAAIEQARLKDVPALIELMGNAVPDCAPQTVWELPWNWPQYRVLRDDSGDVIAAGSLQGVEEDGVEIRGIVVHPSRRGTGIASRLLSGLLKEAQDGGKTAFCITAKPAFFERFGFAHTDQLRRIDWPRNRPDRAPWQRLTMQFCPQEASHA